MLITSVVLGPLVAAGSDSEIQRANNNSLQQSGKLCSVPLLGRSTPLQDGTYLLHAVSACSFVAPRK